MLQIFCQKLYFLENFLKHLKNSLHPFLVINLVFSLNNRHVGIGEILYGNTLGEVKDPHV